MNLYASSVNTVQRMKNAITIAKLTFPIVARLERFPGIPSSVAILVLGVGVLGVCEGHRHHPGGGGSLGTAKL